MINFYIAQKTIHSLKVRSNSMLVYYDLCRRANQSDLCWPAKKTIAEDCNISKSSVTRALRELEREGLIITVPRHRDLGNGQTSNYYHVFDTPQVLPEAPETPVLSEPNTSPKQQRFEENTEGELSAASSVDEPKDQLVAITPEQAPEPSVNTEHIELHSGERCGIPSVNTETTLQNVMSNPFNQAVFDTPPHVTVTSQEGIPETKATNNPRKESIFSQVVKWYHRQKKKRAGNSFFPAKNECL